MNSLTKTKRTTEFGDFQTPPELARKACEILTRLNFQPRTIVEPTCGRGNFLFAALESFPTFTKAIGIDISPAYIAEAKLTIGSRADKSRIEIIESDFFKTDWLSLLQYSPEPLLVVGNPPWVTNASLSVLNSSNVPDKSNFQKHNGFDAMTGKSNFDISEWMLIRILHLLKERDAVMAMMCKTAVARKLLLYAHKHDINFSEAHIYRLDALSCFNAAVDACFFVCKFSSAIRNPNCRVYDDFEAGTFQTISNRDDELIASLELFERWKHLRGAGKKWRSGIKHDCAKVMELWQEEEGKYRNGFDEAVELESHYIFPMLKSSEVANSAVVSPKRRMLVTQNFTGEDTSSIAQAAPKTWAYLQCYAHLLDKRGSSIYKNRPRFSIFGVGEYSFAQWKIAISGFYKKLFFKVVEEYEGKPIVLDDTSYFIPCATRTEAYQLAELLNSNTAKEFYEAHIFWDAKRPITAELLRRLDLEKLAEELCLSPA
ncbi:MAG: class I SAM-dependent methyltransferase [Pyrinomonadaceae bacterium MAG19_C2-C3]|nr:class I SAM-dependent methyltransferase [Pyrinomonadaceae bacterium MAG19_C2-C3]